MHNWKSKLRWLMAILVLSSLWWWQQMPDDSTHLVFCNVGQGDAALIVRGPFQAIIDTGPSGELLGKCLDAHIPFWDRRIELVLISHMQKDHNGGLEWLKNRYSVGRLVTQPTIGDVIRYKDLYFDILWSDKAGKEISSDDNDGSNVVEVKWKKFRALFTGDITQKAELALVSSGVLESIDVLKVPHHGSKYSSSELFLERLAPKLTVISVGAKNTYGHPSSDTLIRLDGVGAKVARTDKNGEIEVIEKGEVLGFKTER